MGFTPAIVVVTRSTRLEKLRERWVTTRQVQFALAQAHVHEGELRRKQGRTRDATQVPAAAAQAEFDEYQHEDDQYQRTIEQIERDLDFGMPVKLLDRALVPNFDFWNAAAVVVVGQDGLVANTAKYVGDLPIIGVNPDPRRFDGVLLPFVASQARAAVGRVLENKHRIRSVTLAEATLNDGQKMLAFNDFFVGCRTHVSARYTLEVAGRAEPQSSSGILVSTGAGSTGWLSSVFNMAAGIGQLVGTQAGGGVQLAWEDRQLVWAVREPFISRHSQANLVAGLLAEQQQLVVESLMPAEGVIFSDGIENDFLQFNSGAIARIGVAQQRARLVVG
jgi:NAD kinase